MEKSKYDGYMAAIHYLVLCKRENIASIDIGRLMFVSLINDPYTARFSCSNEQVYKIVFYYPNDVIPKLKLYNKANLEFINDFELEYPFYRDFKNKQITYKYARTFILRPKIAMNTSSSTNIGEITLLELVNLYPYLDEFVMPYNETKCSIAAKKALLFLK